MSYKWIGAVLVIMGCGGMGFSVAANYKREERMLRQLLDVLRFMECELQYRLTPLPELCRQAGTAAKGMVQETLLCFVRELESQIAPDAASCMRSAVNSGKDLPGSVRTILIQLGQTLGRFDLPGQIQGIEASKDACRSKLDALNQNREERLRGYQTLGLCAGAALVILLI